MRRIDKRYFIIAMGVVVVLLALLRAQNINPSQSSAYKEISSSSTTVITELSTSTTTEKVTTTVPEITTTTSTVAARTTVTTLFVPRTTTTEQYIPTTVPEISVSGAEGPPRNVTTLVGCIAYYESTWGDISSNVFQFEQGTWETYGGTGSPSKATYSRQETIFWIAWEDDGHHHWAAQKGRCF